MEEPGRKQFSFPAVQAGRARSGGLTDGGRDGGAVQLEWRRRRKSIRQACGKDPTGKRRLELLEVEGVWACSHIRPMFEFSTLPSSAMCAFLSLFGAGCGKRIEPLLICADPCAEDPSNYSLHNARKTTLK